MYISHMYMLTCIGGSWTHTQECWQAWSLMASGKEPEGRGLGTYVLFDFTNLDFVRQDHSTHFRDPLEKPLTP